MWICDEEEPELGKETRVVSLTRSISEQVDPTAFWLKQVKQALGSWIAGSAVPDSALTRECHGDSFSTRPRALLVPYQSLTEGRSGVNGLAAPLPGPTTSGC